MNRSEGNTTDMTTGVVIPQCLRTSETLQEGICRQHHVLDLLDAAIASSRYCRDVLHDPLRSFGLPRTRLARDDNTLVLVVRVHVVVRGFCDTEYVGRNLQTVLALVLLQYIVGVDAQI